MIQKSIQEILLEIIAKKMIPEYTIMINCKEELKAIFLDYVENKYLSERDKELISKYPSLIKQVSNIPVVHYGYRSGIKKDLEYFRGDLQSALKLSDLILVFEKPIPEVCEYIFDLKKHDPEEWEKIGPIANKYINIRNSFIRKLNIACEFLKHENSTITLIKKEFPDLYKLYKDKK